MQRKPSIFHKGHSKRSSSLLKNQSSSFLNDQGRNKTRYDLMRDKSEVVLTSKQKGSRIKIIEQNMNKTMD